MPSTLLHAARRIAAGLAAFAIVAAYPSSALAAEVITTDCLHGSGDSYSSDYRAGNGSAYSNDHGDQYGSRYSYTRPDDGGFRGGFRRGFGGRFHRTFVARSRDDNGGGSINGVDAGSSNGYRNGYANGSETGARTAYNSTSCVEVRHELVNPFVTPIPRVQGENREAENRERLWRAHCKPVLRTDRYGVDRYSYAAPGCEFGKYE
jgi:hypothetical protein